MDVDRRINSLGSPSRSPNILHGAGGPLVLLQAGSAVWAPLQAARARALLPAPTGSVAFLPCRRPVCPGSSAGREHRSLTPRAAWGAVGGDSLAFLSGLWEGSSWQRFVVRRGKQSPAHRGRARDLARGGGVAEALSTGSPAVPLLVRRPQGLAVGSEHALRGSQ